MPWEQSRKNRYFVIRNRVDGKRFIKCMGPGEKGRLAEQEHLRKRDEAIDARARTVRILDEMRGYEAVTTQLNQKLLSSLGYDWSNMRWRSEGKRDQTIRNQRVYGNWGEKPSDLDDLIFECSFWSSRLRTSILENWDDPEEREGKAHALDEVRTSLTNDNDHVLVSVFAEQTSLFWLEEHACALYATRIGEEEYFQRYGGAMERRQNMVHTRFCRAMKNLARAKALGLEKREVRYV